MTTNVIELKTELGRRAKADRIVFRIELDKLEDWFYFKEKLIEQGLFGKYMIEKRRHG